MVPSGKRTFVWLEIHLFPIGNTSRSGEMSIAMFMVYLFTGFAISAISSAETTLKHMRNPTSPRDKRYLSIFRGPIFPWNKVQMVDPDLHERLFFGVNVDKCTSPMDATGMGATEPTARTLNHEFPMSHPDWCHY